MIAPKYETPRRRKKSIGRTSKWQVDKVRDDVFKRDDWLCVAFGSWGRCAGRLTVQHAIGRGMGGSALYDGAASLRTMCVHHNDLAESDAKFARLCSRWGWSLSRLRTDVDPERIPVRYPDGRDYLLSNQGFGRVLLMPYEAAELRALYGMGAD